MKKEVTQTETVCDECGKVCYESCLDCGADYCYNHWKELGVEYHCGVYSSRANGYYCLGCDARLRASRDDSLHAAYSLVKALIGERNVFFEDFNERAEKAEKRVEALREARGTRD